MRSWTRRYWPYALLTVAIGLAVYSTHWHFSEKHPIVEIVSYGVAIPAFVVILATWRRKGPVQDISLAVLMATAAVGDWAQGASNLSTTLFAVLAFGFALSAIGSLLARNKVRRLSKVSEN